MFAAWPSILCCVAVLLDVHLCEVAFTCAMSNAGVSLPCAVLWDRVACTPYGGPIAMVRDDRKLVVVSGGITKPVVRIFTAAGETLAAFMWDHGRVAGMGWTNEEDLLIVEDGGEVCTLTTTPKPMWLYIF